METQPKPQNQLNIELTPEVAEGVYSNLAFITHSSSEFVIDFIRVMPNAPNAKVKSRIIFTPEHAKRFLQTLQENITIFENQFGNINSPGAGYAPPIMGFDRA